MVIHTLNESNTILIPFVIDLFGGLGPIANKFLFGLHPDLPPMHLTFTSPTSQETYDNATLLAAPTGFTQ